MQLLSSSRSQAPNWFVIQRVCRCASKGDCSQKPHPAVRSEGLSKHLLWLICLTADSVWFIYFFYLETCWAHREKEVSHMYPLRNRSLSVSRGATWEPGNVLVTQCVAHKSTSNNREKRGGQYLGKQSWRWRYTARWIYQRYRTVQQLIPQRDREARRLWLNYGSNRKRPHTYAYTNTHM